MEHLPTEGKRKEERREKKGQRTRKTFEKFRN